MIKNTLVFFICLFIINRMEAQQYEGLLNTPVQFVENVNILQLKEHQVYISMPFAKEEILNKELKGFLKQNIIQKIELVYTQFRADESFNQKELNKKRLDKLYQLIPELFDNPLWEFQLVEQTFGNSKNECEGLFHGFIFTLRPYITDHSLQQEAKFLEDFFKQKTRLDSLNKPDKSNAKYEIKSRWDDKVGYVHDSILIKEDDFYFESKTIISSNFQFIDSTVTSVFNRNNHWKNMMIVLDATGSMSPYIAQALLWIKEQSENNRASFFVFFNDGNKTKSHLKEIGNTGGIYPIENSSFEEVLKTVTECMKKGSGGGESLENDIEAILTGMKYSDNYDEIILIADNYESMRDFELIPEINKPVRVILCGAGSRINVQYLSLAKETNGSFHTSKSDLNNLDQIKENDTIEIEDKTYKYKNGKFHFVN
ncbi:MAG: hypothetical protein M3Q58_11300 [Bacteroidota bacterium]|nr:hypothetical protein [Bacteroidota bacterium]